MSVIGNKKPPKFRVVIHLDKRGYDTLAAMVIPASLRGLKKAHTRDVAETMIEEMTEKLHREYPDLGFQFTMEKVESFHKE